MRISNRFLSLRVLALWCILNQVYSVPFHHRKESSRAFVSCKSSEKCVSVVECPTTNIDASIKKKRCGTEDFYPKVCCPETHSSVPTHPSADFSACGKSKKVEEMLNQILKGKNSTLGHWPWMVALFYPPEIDSEPEFMCGASLISRQWVITAAHCVTENVDKNQLTVRLGDLDLDSKVQDGASPIEVSVDGIVRHPQFSLNPKIINDIALLHLKNPINFTENLRPVCLLSGRKYKDSRYYDEKKAFTIGWGRVGYELNASSSLLETEVSVISPRKCARQYLEFKDILVDEKVICAGGPETGTCNGDSGGPLLFFNKDEASFYLGGLTSGGYQCNVRNYSTRFTKVAHYVSWINEVTGEEF